VLSKAPGIKLDVLDPLGSQGMMRFNHVAKPTDNAMVRRAIMQAIKQQVQFYDEFQMLDLLITDAGVAPTEGAVSSSPPESSARRKRFSASPVEKGSSPISGAHMVLWVIPCRAG
jgi:hypothetical protein